MRSLPRCNAVSTRLWGDQTTIMVAWRGDETRLRRGRCGAAWDGFIEVASVVGWTV